MSSAVRDNEVGPYTILRRLRSSLSRGEVGRVYAAWHRASGRPALLVAPAGGEQHYTPASEWRLRMRASISPPYMAVEVEQGPAGNAPLTELSAGMDAACQALEDFERHPEALAHLCTPPGPRRRAQLAARTPYWAALAGVVLLALVCVSRVWLAAGEPARGPGGEARATAAEEALLLPEELPVAGADPRRAWQVLALDMPKRPFPGQYRVDKQGKCKVRAETPINGGCWVALKLAPPCGDDAYEHKDTCYWPSMPSAKDPSSTLPQRTPPAPAQERQ
jgi:hypothetical protein